QDGKFMFDYNFLDGVYYTMESPALARGENTLKYVFTANADNPFSGTGELYVNGEKVDETVLEQMHISTYSLKTLADAFMPLMTDGGSIVGLDFDNSQAWPAYNWMGVAKSALQSLSRYLAKELGPRQIRCNLVAAGPVRTMAAKSIPGFALFEDTWDGRSPLGWDVNDADPVARACVALLSDWFPKTTGEVVHVDGGYHAVGA
ncbi:MAG: SDR family oxidoreductase, partial [Ilumatobacteraceae bacterium]